VWAHGVPRAGGLHLASYLLFVFIQPDLVEEPLASELEVAVLLLILSAVPLGLLGLAFIVGTFQ